MCVNPNNARALVPTSIYLHAKFTTEKIFLTDPTNEDLYYIKIMRTKFINQNVSLARAKKKRTEVDPHKLRDPACGKS